MINVKTLVNYLIPKGCFSVSALRRGEVEDQREWRDRIALIKTRQFKSPTVSNENLRFISTMICDLYCKIFTEKKTIWPCACLFVPRQEDFCSKLTHSQIHRPNIKNLPQQTFRHRRNIKNLAQQIFHHDEKILGSRQKY